MYRQNINNKHTYLTDINKNHKQHITRLYLVDQMCLCVGFPVGYMLGFSADLDLSSNHPRT